MYGNLLENISQIDKHKTEKQRQTNDNSVIKCNIKKPNM